MSETASPQQSNIEYTQAQNFEQSATPPVTNVTFPHQRITTASNTQETIELRFTPRAVRQFITDTKTY
jgi:hypothetical protein